MHRRCIRSLAFAAAALTVAYGLATALGVPASLLSLIFNLPMVCVAPLAWWAYRSAPAGSRHAANATMYALTTHSTSAKPAWKSRAMDGSATATTFVSSVISAQVADAVSRTKRLSDVFDMAMRGKSERVSRC